MATILGLNPIANTSFALAVLHRIATDPRLAHLRDGLVLKGGAALALAYKSGRLTRKDLDFDIKLMGVEFTPDDAQVLIASLQLDWQATYSKHPRAPGQFTRRGESDEIGPIGYRDPRDQLVGLLNIQISRRRVPPPLVEYIEEAIGHDPLTGEAFVFSVVSLEHAAAEKCVRTFSWRGPKTSDLYDLGFISLKCDLEHDTFADDFHSLYDDEIKDIQADHNVSAIHALVRRAVNAVTPNDAFPEPQTFEPEVTLEIAQDRIKAGAIFALDLIGEDLDWALIEVPE